MEQVKLGAESVKVFVNGCFKSNEPWQVVTITASTVLTGVWLWHFLDQEENLVSRCKKTIFRLVRKIPTVREKIETEMVKINNTFEKDVIARNNGVLYTTTLPQKSSSSEEIIKMIESHLQAGEYKWKEGFVSGAVYNFDPNLIKLLTNVYGLASYTNPLHPDIFPGVCKMEAEVVRMTANLFHGGPDACGTGNCFRFPDC